ncbi:MAG: ferrochelatase [Betaproteobacteria bacterium TMED156]|nr:MAG: ferrochelatase [Betaproteobacteria bacterium TMED156]
MIEIEPNFIHGSHEKTGILLVNLGTPDEPSAISLRKYLKEFLSDPRVVEIPSVVWWPILNFIILTFRPKKSAEKYASVWTKDGSPLRVHSERQLAKVRENLIERGMSVEVSLAMRYGNPSIAASIDELRKKNVTKLLVLPLYPQFSASTTATVFDKVYEKFIKMRNPPALRTVKSFHDSDFYVLALADQVFNFWKSNPRPDLLLFSFHGVPVRSLYKGDPYHCHCHKTARLVAEKIGLKDGEWKVAFQSRFGKAEWLKPYTTQVIQNLPNKGVKNLHVICPGFVSDCLETLEEIAMEAKEDFLDAGGAEFKYIPCLNDGPYGIEFLSKLIVKELDGWPTVKLNEKVLEEKKIQKELALKKGATI